MKIYAKYVVAYNEVLEIMKSEENGNNWNVDLWILLCTGKSILYTKVSNIKFRVTLRGD